MIHLIAGAAVAHERPHFNDKWECPDGFERHGASCYAFAQGPSTYTAASVICEQYGAMLACPLDLAEALYLGAMARNRGLDFWIGANDVLTEGQWVFPCGVANYTAQFPWCPSEPNNGGGGISNGADCVRIVGRSGPGNGNCAPGLWADYRCDADHDGDQRPFGFICELNPEKEEDWWEEDDDDDDDDLFEDAIRNVTSNNPAAIAFAVIGCLGCWASLALNALLIRRGGGLRASLSGLSGRSRTGVTSTAAASNTNYLAASTYRAPLTEPGAITSDASNA